MPWANSRDRSDHKATASSPRWDWGGGVAMAGALSKKPAFPAWPPPVVGARRQSTAPGGRLAPRSHIPSPHRSRCDGHIDERIGCRPHHSDRISCAWRRIGVYVDCVPMYIDRHDAPGVTPEEIANAHRLDVAIQDTHGVHYHTYWFEPENGSVFCSQKGRASRRSRPYIENRMACWPARFWSSTS